MKLQKWCGLPLLVVIVLNSQGRADNEAKPGSGRIQGRIIDIASGSPLAGVSVIMPGWFGGAVTDSEGTYTLEGLPPGSYGLQFSRIGYETKVIEGVELPPGSSVRVDAVLVEKPIKLNDVTVVPGRFQVMGSQPVAQQSLTQGELATAPQLADDFFRAVRRLPGISGNDFSARFKIRGGEYDEILVTLDGMELYEPFHLKDFAGGGVSAIDVAAVEGIDLMTGGFSAKYGDKMSGVFDIKSRLVPASHKRFLISLSVMNLHFFSEGVFANNRGSWLVSARRGYLDLVMRLAGAEEQLKPTYYDLFGKTRYVLNNKQVLTASFFHGRDDLRIRGEEQEIGDTLESSYGNTYGWLILWSELNPKIITRTILSVGQVERERWGQDYSVWAGNIREMAHDNRCFSFVNFKTDWDIDLADWYFLQLGFDSKQAEAKYNYVNQVYTYIMSDSGYGGLAYADTTIADLHPSGSKLGIYLSNRVRPWRPATIELGLRYDRASYSDDDKISPRVNVLFDLGSATSFRTGWGHYYQIEGINEIAVGDGETEFCPAQRAEHFVAGLQHNFDNGILFRLEAYYKSYSGLQPHYRNSFDDIDAFPETESDRVTVNREKRIAKGLEIYANNRAGGKFSWRASYAYARVTDSVSTIAFPPNGEIVDYDRILPGPNDQRHTLYVDWSFRPTHRWQFNMAFQFHSGWPYTGKYLVTEPGIYAQSDEQLGKRHNSYKRLDLRINRYWKVGRGRITAYLDLINVLGNKNVRRYSYNIYHNGDEWVLDEKPEYWFGRLPSFGMQYEVVF